MEKPALQEVAVRALRSVAMVFVFAATSSSFVLAQNNAPIVTAATQSAAGDTLFISGSGFGSSPIVTLGGVVLGGVLVDSPGTSITAVMPALPPGSYELSVESAKNKAVNFEITIGTQGPPGPAGSPGATGSPGLPGASVILTTLLSGDAHCPSGGTQFTVGAATSYACNGAPAAAKTCPVGYVQHGPALCAENIDASGLSFSAAANRCRLAGAHLPSSGEMRAVMQSGVTIGNGGVIGDWVDDQDVAGSALVINSNTDTNAMVSVPTTGTQFGRCFISLE